MNNFVGYKRFLTIVNVVVLTMLVILFYLGFFTQVSSVIFFSLIIAIFGVCFYSPMIGFALFVGLLPLEIINIAPETLGLGLRPYQIFGIAALSGIGVSMAFQKNRRKCFQWNAVDTSVLLLALIGVCSAVVNSSADHVVRSTVIMFSFAVLYFIVRLFIHQKKDVIALIPIIISSGVVISFYAVAQNILFALESTHQQIMPGRPNATFAEPDWLGMYLVFIFATGIAYLYYHAHFRHLWRLFDIALYFAMWIIVTALIITVARSAWLGAGAVLMTYFVILGAQKQYKLAAKHAVWVSSIFLLSLITVFVFNLTSFELGNRAQSTSSGLQEITVSCVDANQKELLLNRSVISHIDELSSYNCRHINLEEIAEEELQGNYVFKIYRNDPNVTVRAEVFGKSITAIKQRPVLGYGWGSSEALLGRDEAGTPLNASNIFLEIGIATGIVGIIIFLGLILSIVGTACRVLCAKQGNMQKSIAIFAILGLVAIGVPNLFNAGLLLGFVWVFLGMVAILRKML